MAEHLSGHIMQDNDLSEFDESREIIEGLVDEYKACESPDYIKWGMEVFLGSTLYCMFYNVEMLIFYHENRTWERQMLRPHLIQSWLCKYQGNVSVLGTASSNKVLYTSILNRIAT
jgi:hypothetical protein